MIRAIIFATLIAVPFASRAQDGAWEALSGGDIREAFTGKILDYGEKWQDFRGSGRTLYFSGQESWGYWAVRGDQYCSMWPPSDFWGCYDIERRGDTLRFVGASGDFTEATYKDEGG